MYVLLGVVIVWCTWLGIDVCLLLPFHNTRTQPHTVGGGRGPYKFSTLSGNEAAEGKLGWGSFAKISQVVLATAAVTGLMWEVMARHNKLEMARLQDKAEAEARRIRDKAEAEAGRIRDQAEAEVTRIQDKAEAEAGLHKMEVTRIQDKADADAARLRDKAQIYEYFVQVVATKNYGPLKDMMDEDEKKRKKGAAAAP